MTTTPAQLDTYLQGPLADRVAEEFLHGRIAPAGAITALAAEHDLTGISRWEIAAWLRWRTVRRRLPT